METLGKQIRRAQRRLILQSWAGKWAWCLFATLLLAVAAIAANKLWPFAEPQAWAIGSLATAVGLGTVASLVWTWARRQDALNAAVEIDRRFGLKERVSSALALGPVERESAIAQALVRDAEQRVSQIDVRDQFGLRLDRRALLPLLPAAAAFVVAVFVNGRDAQQPTAVAAAETTQVKKSAQALVKRLEAERKEAAAKGLDEAESLLKQLSDETKNLQEKSQSERKQALVALNDLVKDVEKRRQQLAASNDIKQQLNQLKDLQPGPAEKLGQALKQGDLNKAINELEKLKDQLTGDKLTPEAKQELAKQLEQLKDSLRKKVEAAKEAQQALKRKIEEERKNGNVAEADKLQQQLDKMMEKDPQLDKMNQMAQALEKAAEATKKGEDKQAAEALSQLSTELAGMQKELSEMETLDSAMEQVADAKNAMSCKECEGDGCENCQGQDFKMSDKWSQTKNARGGGVGAGPREEAKNETQLHDSQVKQNVGKGASVFKGMADGANRKGQVQEAIKSDFSEAQQQTAEALTGQKLPHDYRDHAKKYFDALREGQK